MHLVYRKRCERDGLELESMWLGDEDLEPDDDASVPIEQPTAIVLRLLSEKDQDDRVRMILGPTSGDPLPEVDRKILLAYHCYHKDHLEVPVPGEVRGGRHAPDHPTAPRSEGMRPGRGGAALRGPES